MQTITIRPALSDDLPALAYLWHEKMILTAQFDHHLRLAPNATAQWILAAAGWIADADCHMLAAHHDGACVGYIIGRVQDAPPGLLPTKVGLVAELAVDAHARLGGVGRLLVDGLRNWFAEQGIEHVTAQVARRNAVEQAFWRAQGAAEWADVLWMKW
jgi:ribosomal protein S18 acetylase RimI-like enzyme